MSTDDDLLGAWALDALTDDKRAQVDAAVGADPQLRQRADRLHDVVAAIAGSDATAPPADLRARVLSAALQARRAREPEQTSPVILYRKRADDLAALLAELEPDHWQCTAAPYQWTVHGLLAHLLQVEHYLADILGLEGAQPPADAQDHLLMGADAIAAQLRRPPADTVAAWRNAVERNTRMVERADLGRSVVFHVWPFTLGSLLVARGFELWTHADDIRRAIGRPLAEPTSEELVTMSQVSVGSLPLAVHVVMPGRVPDGTARVVLTGPAGGTFDLTLGAGGERLVTMALDVVDYCRVVARRQPTGELSMQVDGDDTLAEQLLRASSVVAV